jgi:hypothetical protein
MQTLRIAGLIAALIAVPAGARSILSRPAPAPCFSFGGAQYRLTTEATADYTVRVAKTAAAADIRLQLVETPDTADFVLMDDGEPPVCTDAAIRTIRIETDSETPDISVRVSREPADQRLYVRSAAFSPEQAAGLFAVLWRKPAGELHAAAQPRP